jgi:TPR repeat protein
VQEYAAAQYNLGNMHENIVQAVYWWQKAAEQGFAAAQYVLGDMYRELYKDAVYRQ